MCLPRYTKHIFPNLFILETSVLMENIRFSIITITYNAGKVLQPTIDSIREQSYPDIEYIIIDGASTDNTLEIIKRNESEITYYVSEKDNGLYDAMNKGLKAATGDYVLFLNAGDSLHSPFTLRNIVSSIKENSMKNDVYDKSLLPDIIYGETAIIDSQRNFMEMRRLSAPKKLTYKSFIWGMLVCHQSFIVKREIAPLYDTNYRFSSDFDWCIRCMKQSKKIFNSELIISDYLNEGLTTNNRNASLKERFRIMSKYYSLPLTVGIHIWFFTRTAVSRMLGVKS